MPRKKRPKQGNDTLRSAQGSQDRRDTNASHFLNGRNAKWIFFAIYFVVTIFLFREFLFSDDMLYGSDTIPDGVYTRRYYKEYHAEYGGVPHWNPYVLGGLPFVDAMHGDTFYPGAWLKFYMPLTRALGHKLVWHVFLAGIMMYIFLRTLGLRRDASFLGGLMYMLAPSFVTLVYPAHDAKMYVIAWLPLAFTFLERGMVHMRFIWFSLLGAVMGLLILTSHAQMAYYSYWALGFYFVFRLLTVQDRGVPQTTKLLGLFAAAVAIAVTLGAIQLLPAYKFSTTQSVRTGAARSRYEYATSWSLHPEEVAGMVVPSFQGNSFIDARSGGIYGTDLYWGRNSFKLNSDYHGIIPLVFALLALLVCRTRAEWFFSGLGLFSLVYALGANTPFYRLFYTLVPGVKSFRAPSMIVFLFCFAIVVMSARFISRLFDRDTALRYGDKRLWYTVGGIIFTAVLVTAAGRGFFEFWTSVFYRGIDDQKVQIMVSNIPVFTSDMWRVAIMLCVSLAGVWMFLSKKIGSFALVCLIAFVTFIDQAVIDNRFITTIDPATHQGIAPDAMVRELQARNANDGHYRTLSLLPSLARIHQANYYPMFGIEIADGFHNNELKSYELFRGENRNFLRYWFDSFTLDKTGLAKNNWLKVAGVRYILMPYERGTDIIENEYALPRVYVTHDYTVAGNDTAAVRMLADPAFDPARTVVLEKGDEIPFEPADVPGRATEISGFEYTSDGAIVNVQFDTPGFLVLTDNYVPYWQASVDGEPAAIYRAYGTFMAVPCDRGEHTIEFRYRSGSYEKGKRLTFVSLVFIVVSCLTSGVVIFNRKRRSEST